MISCIILSAGLSSRFGYPKALTLLTNQTIIQHIQKKLLLSKIDEIIIILGKDFEKIKPQILNHKRIKTIYNKNFQLGQTSSFKAGINALSKDILGIMLLPIDYPVIQVQTINFLYDRFLTDRPSILIPIYQQHKGHPPIFHSNLIKDFLALDDSIGLNTFIKSLKVKICEISVNDPGIIKTFNTKAEFESINEEYKENFC